MGARRRCAVLASHVAPPPPSAAAAAGDLREAVEQLQRAAAKLRGADDAGQVQLQRAHVPSSPGMELAPLTANRPGEGPHRVAMSQWYVVDGVPRTDDRGAGDVNQMFAYCRRNGYCGMEMSVGGGGVHGRIGFAEHYFGSAIPLEEVAVQTRRAAEAYGVSVTGALWFIPHHVWDNEEQLLATVRRHLRAEALAGGRYIDCQMDLSPQYKGAGSEYVDDADYLAEQARRTTVLMRETNLAGLNFYLETHVDRITHDIRGACKILDLCPPTLEIGGDLSHYIMLNITQGPSLARVLSRMGHFHCRMARAYGDLSVEVADPKRDWEAHGVTWQAFTHALPGLKGGLSSRTIVDEAGPMHIVKDAMEQGRRMLPLLRAMCTWADNDAAGRGNPALQTPLDLTPFK